MPIEGTDEALYDDRAGQEDASPEPVTEDLPEIPDGSALSVSIEETDPEQETESAEKSQEDALQSQEAVTDEAKGRFMTEANKSDDFIDAGTGEFGEIIESGSCQFIRHLALTVL